MEFITLEVTDEDKGDKSLVIFNTPKDVEGTALLSHAKILDPDDQWLFLPALKRVKRISSKNKSGPFVGSEFAFEDFTSTELNKYDYLWLRQEACGDMICDVIQRKPRYKYSGYKKQIAWIDQKDLQLRKIEFYNRRDSLLKTLTLEDYRQYGSIWRAHKLHMLNHSNGKSTDLIYDNYQFKVGLTDNDFVKGRLAELR
jgi:outer membrane lipoprotein-sorting protein